MAEHNETGAKGEEIAAKWLANKGFLIIDRNYRKKWGELDIVAEKSGLIHFVEVKTVSRRSYPTPLGLRGTSSVFEQEINSYRPEENMHPRKIQRLRRALQTYILEKRLEERPWQFDLACVFLDMERRVAKVRLLENIIL